VLLHAFQEPEVGANEFSKVSVESTLMVSSYIHDHKAPESMLLNFGSHTTHQMDMTMWLVLNGKERTLDEFKIIGQVPSTPHTLTLFDLL
jgi:hypothetical protein